jgi:hypothetical protein
VENIMEPDCETSMLEIVDLLHAYAWSFDTNNIERLKGLFSVDAVAKGRVHDSEGKIGPWRGRESIGNALAEVRAANPHWHSHQCTTPVITTLTANSASVKTYLSLYSCEKGKTPELVVTGEYQAKVSKLSGSWKFDALDLTLDSAI